MLTYLVQDLVFVLSFFKTLIYINHWFFSGGILDVLFSMYPDLACSITTKTPVILIGMILVWAICAFKTFAGLYPNVYLSLNHEKVRIAVIVVTIAIWISELSIVLLLDGTFCSKGEALLFYTMTEVQFDVAQTKLLLFFILMKTILACFAKLVHWIAGRQQKNVLSRQDIHIGSTEASSNLGKETEMVVVHEEQSATESNCPVRSTQASQTQPDNILEVLQIFQQRDNAIVPVGVVVPQGKTKIPYILQTSGYILSVLSFFIYSAILLVLGISTEKWVLGYSHARDLIFYACVLGWVHRSDEISEYAIRKITQFLASYQN